MIVGSAIETCAQKVGLAHVERIETALARDCVHDALDGDHALWTAKAAKGGVGYGVGLQAAGQDRNVREPVAIAGVKHRAVTDAGRKVRGTTAACVECHLVTCDHTPVVISHSPIGAEIVTLAGQGEIVVAIETDLAWLSGPSRGKRGDRRPGAGLAFLAAEAAAHAARLNGNQGVRYSKDAGDDVLRLGRILRRSMYGHLVRFAGKGEGRLPFKIEVLLAADREFAIQPAPSPLNRGLRVAAAERIVVLNSRAADKRIRDRDRRRFGLDVDLREPRCPARLVARARDDCEQRLPVEHHVLFDEEGLIGEDRRNVVLAGNIRRGQDSDDTGGATDRLQAQALQFATGFVRHADRDMQRARGLADVIDVSRRALDMQARGIVRQRLMNDCGRRRVDDGRVIIRRHGAFQSVWARSRPRFP